MEQIAAAKIKIYEFPEVEDGEEAERKENRRMKVELVLRLPLARILSSFRAILSYLQSSWILLSHMQFVISLF